MSKYFEQSSNATRPKSNVNANDGDLWSLKVMEINLYIFAKGPFFSAA